MGMYKQTQGHARECSREGNGVSNVAEGLAWVRDAGLLLIPGLHHKTLISWANSASRVVEKMKAKMCEGFAVFCSDQLIYASCYYVNAKGKFESCCTVSI